MLDLQTQMASGDVISLSVLTNMAKGQRSLSMSGYEANSLLTQLALTSPEHSILHSGPKLCTGSLQYLCTTHLFLLLFCYFAHSGNVENVGKTQNMILFWELLLHDSLTHYQGASKCWCNCGFWEGDTLLNISQCQLHPVPSYVILEAMTMEQFTISHSLSDSCIFMHIYEGVIPLNVAVSLCWGLFWI